MTFGSPIPRTSVVGHFADVPVDKPNGSNGRSTVLGCYLLGLFNFEVVSGGYVDAKGALDLRTASTWNRIRAVRIATS